MSQKSTTYVYEDSVCALINLQIYNSFSNIISSNSCFQIITFHVECVTQNTTQLVTFEPGFCRFKDIRKYFLDVLKKLKTEFEDFEMEFDSKTFQYKFKSSYTIDINVKNSLAPVQEYEKKCL